MTYALTPKAGVSGARLGTAAQTVTDSSTTLPAAPANLAAGGGFSCWTPMAIAASLPDRAAWSYAGAELLRLAHEGRAEIAAAAAVGASGISEDVGKYEPPRRSEAARRSITVTRQSGMQEMVSGDPSIAHSMLQRKRCAYAISPLSL